MARRTKHLDYRVLHSTAIAHDVLGGRWSRHIKVEVEGHEVRDPYLLGMELLNSGRTPIMASDFDGHLRIAADQTVLVYRVVASEPKNLRVSISRGEGDDQLLVSPILLNPGDKFTIEAITEGEPSLSVQARLAGVKSVRELSKETIGRKAFLWPASSSESADRHREMMLYTWRVMFLSGLAMLVAIWAVGILDRG